MQDIQILINNTIQEITSMFENDKSGHNIDHLIRTMNIARKIQKREGGNLRVIVVSALLHDIHRIMATEKNVIFVSPADSLPVVKNILNKLDLTDEEKDHICYAIEHHEEYAFGGGKVTVTDIESKILQDADNIDASGAIGIARAMGFGTTYNVPIYDNNIPLEYGDFEEKFLGKTSIHYLYNKCTRLHKTMNTKTGVRICKQRCQFVKKYIKQVIKEWN